jgi:tricorn protease
MHAVFVYSVASAKSHQITDGLSDALSPSFDKGGKYLYFLASTNFGLNTGWLDMTSYDRPVTRSVYVAVLAKETASPFAPESDEEKAETKDSTAAAKPSDKEKKETKKDSTASKDVKIDIDGIDQRIVAVERISPRNYSSLTAGAEGSFYYLVPFQLSFLVF